MISKLVCVSILSAVLLLTGVSTNPCSLPPSVWCSSREVARRCDVEKQCEPYLTPKPKAKAEEVRFTLYMESLCSDCVNFIKQQLWPAFIGVGSIMNLALVPYGNANETEHGGKWEFECQFGEEECYGNIIETCAIYFYPESAKHFPFIHCIEASSALPRYSAPGCAQKCGLHYFQIKACADGPLGNSLEHEMAVKTENLDPPHDHVPWVTLNGVHTDKIQEKAEQNLIKLICDTYQGTPIPPACLLDATV